MKKIELYQGLNQLVNKLGFDIRRYPTRDQRSLVQYLEKHDVQACFDIGANTGQYGKMLRSFGYSGRILSFEPQKTAFTRLAKKAAAADKWDAYNIGLGDKDGTSVINISKNSVSSSILHINKILTDASPDSGYIGQEDIQIKRLDSFTKEINFTNPFFLKIDAQGFESKILDGAAGCFDNIYALQLELACVSVYQGEKLFDEMKAFVQSKGFYLSSLESGFFDPKDGRLLEVEAIFLRES